MRFIRRSPVLLLALVVAIALSAPAAYAARPLMPNNIGVLAYSYVEALSRVVNPDGSETFIKRVANTPAELAAANQIKGWFADAGIPAQLQPFTYRVTRKSQNVVAFLPAAKKPKSAPTPLVIVGAHYDASAAGAGADDNASGVAVMLETAQRITKYKPEYDIVFVAFGAEEAGLRGSAYYVSQMSAADKARTIAMINFDSLIVGDKLYIHAGANGKTWARDDMLRLIKLRKLPIEMQPGLNPDYPAGLTPDGFSDYTAFNQADIPVVAFESTNWEIGDLDGYVQTEQYGSFWHTPNDNLTTIEQLLPLRPIVRLEAYTELTFEFLKHLNP
jgi:alkaline phosphatase isozyme conversion protein